MSFAVDRLVLVPDDIDLSRSPLAGHLDAETYVLGAFNPALTRLPNGNLLTMVRVAEALRKADLRWPRPQHPLERRRYMLDAWPLEAANTADPRKFMLQGGGWNVMALTSLAWLLPVELTPDGLEIVAHHYDKAITPHADFQMYGLEDADQQGRRAVVDDDLLGEPRAPLDDALFLSHGLDWTFEDIVLDHQNKDMLIFEGLIGGQYWAQIRPLGDLYFAYPPGSEWRAGPSINLASSPDALHWKPYRKPGIRPHSAKVATARMGGGTPPILTDRGWLTLWHGVEPKEIVGIYRTYWSILDKDDPSRTIATQQHAAVGSEPRTDAPD